jgi:hypothetical protein
MNFSKVDIPVLVIMRNEEFAVYGNGLSASNPNMYSSARSHNPLR